MNLAVLDLNSNREGWPGMAGYKGLLPSGLQGRASADRAIPCLGAAAVAPLAYAHLTVVVDEAPTTTDSAFCPGSKLAFVPVLEPGQGFRDKSLEAFVPGGRTGTKGA